MSLDVYLTRPREMQPDDHQCSCDFCDRNARTTTDVYWGKTTHNHNTIANAVGVYSACWRPDDIGITKAHQLIDPLRAGLALLEAKPEALTHLEPDNGWGSVDSFTNFVRAYLRAAEANPDADVRVSR